MKETINNSIFVRNLLVPDVTIGLLAKDKPMTDLVDNQIGVFDQNGKSIDATSDFTKVTAIDIVVKHNSDNPALKYNKNLGGSISIESCVKKANITPYVAPKPKRIRLADLYIQCNKNYALTVSYSNTAVANAFAGARATQTFSYYEGCNSVNSCDSCNTYNANWFVYEMVKQINKANEGGLPFKAYYSEEGTTTLATDLTALEGVIKDVANTKIYDIVIEGIQMSKPAFNGVDMKYTGLVDTDIEAGIYSEEGVNYTSQVVQDIVYENGSGYDLAREEYSVGGYNNNPGIMRQMHYPGALYPYEAFIDKNEKYGVIRIISTPQDCTFSNSNAIAILDKNKAQAADLVTTLKGALKNIGYGDIVGTL